MLDPSDDFDLFSDSLIGRMYQLVSSVMAGNATLARQADSLETELEAGKEADRDALQRLTSRFFSH